MRIPIRLGCVTLLAVVLTFLAGCAVPATVLRTIATVIPTAVTELETLAPTVTLPSIAVPLPQPSNATPFIRPAPFQPSAEIQQLAASATMTDRARTIFFSARPVVDTDRQLFEQHCRAPVSNTGIELGCYLETNRIYLIEIGDPQLHGEMAVTAAHEMLHAAYAQLSPAEQSAINAQLESAVARIHSTNLTRTLQAYRRLEPGQRDNELHSILGTEYGSLGASLEQYYRQYFTNRAVLVADSTRFNQTFAQLESTLAALRGQITHLRAQMQSDLRRHDVAAYNASVPRLNALVQQYNQTLAQYNQLSRELQAEEPSATNQ